jgi:hypothetical protein
VRFGATTLWHFDAEERAPSTTSIASLWPCPWYVRSSPDNEGVVTHHLFPSLVMYRKSIWLVD